MVAGDAVLETVDPTGVLSHVAADAADHLTGGIRGVIEPIACHGAGHPAVDDAGLHREPLIVQVDLQHPAHATGDHQQRLLVHKSTTGKARAAAPSHKRNPVGMAAAQDRGHLLGVLRQHRQRRRVTVHGQAVTVVTQQFLTFRHHGPRRQRPAQIPLQS